MNEVVKAYKFAKCFFKFFKFSLNPYYLLSIRLWPTHFLVFINSLAGEVQNFAESCEPNLSALRNFRFSKVYVFKDCYCYMYHQAIIKITYFIHEKIYRSFINWSYPILDKEGKCMQQRKQMYSFCSFIFSLAFVEKLYLGDCILSQNFIYIDKNINVQLCTDAQISNDSEVK